MASREVFYQRPISSNSDSDENSQKMLQGLKNWSDLFLFSDYCNLYTFLKILMDHYFADVLSLFSRSLKEKIQNLAKT